MPTIKADLTPEGTPAIYFLFSPISTDRMFPQSEGARKR
jgi:hypothetical protein